MSWREQARCIGRIDVFFPEQAKHFRTEQLRTARSICHVCPVIDDCRQYALHNDEQYGIWAGMTITQIRMLRTQLRIHPRPLFPSPVKK